VRIGVVTDSACDLPSELARRLDVAVVPLDVRLGSTPTEEVRVLEPAEFWQLAARTVELPETSAPSPGAFVEAFLSCRDTGAEAVICITISSALSATYEAARSAATAVAADIRVEVVDSRNATMGEGLLVIEAVELARGALPFDDILEQVKAAVPEIHVFGTLDTLDNLRRGGRIGTAQALIGTMLQVKPVIEVRDGVVEGESRQRTRSRSLKYLADKVNTAGPLRRLAVMHAAAPDVAEFTSMLSPSSLEYPLVVSFIGPVIGAHTGAGTIGVCYLRA
jgi:DegV family protein with EDD domain